MFVASFTDAWIETRTDINRTNTTASHLLQMRGLKLIGKMIPTLILVASFTDAWIETFLEVSALIFLVSHLLQMRGLKHFSLDWKHHGHESHLLQMRGLKLLLDRAICLSCGRIFYRCVD